MGPPFKDQTVADTFASYPEPARAALLSLRSMIFATAATTPHVGALEETLKWGQPSYLTPETKSGTTIRLGVPKQGGFAIFTHCQTTVIADFRTLFPDDFAYDGNRGVLFADGEELPLGKLQLLISAALTYKLN